MPTAEPSVLKIILLILAVIMSFNIIIFVHELGHFLAARWRGLQVDRFQIWFGKPIWKKEINGVQYGFGWIPAGGFVALPQMAPMEALEGDNRDQNRDLAPISPLDKIIVAFAGPLFSILLALLAAVVVWGVGKPKDFAPTQIVGGVIKGMPAEKAGILPGDKIVAINGKTVNGFFGSLDSIIENIVLSEGDEIEFTIERPGKAEQLKITSKFEIEKTQWFERTGLRQVGINPEMKSITVAAIMKDSPASRAGFQEGDVLVSMNGQKFRTDTDAIEFVRATGSQPITFEILRKGQPVTLTAKPLVPTSPPGLGPKLGIDFNGDIDVNESIVHPGPIDQVVDTLRMMWVSISKVVSPKSSINASHLSGPVGIAKVQYELLKTDDGWRRILAFFVLFNVNLAVLNMLPLPVLDGGHIVMAILEKIRGRQVGAQALGALQTVCALALISLMLFVTSKDIGSFFTGRKKLPEIVFPAE